MNQDISVSVLTTEEKMLSSMKRTLRWASLFGCGLLSVYFLVFLFLKKEPPPI